MSKTQPYNGLLGLDRLPIGVKIAIWLMTFVLAVGASITLTIISLRAFRYAIDLNGYIIYVTAFALGINCLVGAVLRVVGIRWRYIFLFWLATIPFLFAAWILSYILFPF